MAEFTDPGPASGGCLGSAEDGDFGDRAPRREAGESPLVRFRVGEERCVALTLPRRIAEPVLTVIELSIARMAIAGASSAEIAARRGTSPRTIANQIANIYRKLGLSSRVELAARLS